MHDGDLRAARRRNLKVILGPIVGTFAAIACFAVAAVVAINRWAPPSSSSRPVCFSSEVPLVEAAGRGDASEVRDLLSSGDNPDADDQLTTPLGCAISGGDAEVVRLLLENGADANKVTNKYPAEAPLGLALRYKEDLIVALLLDAGADPNRSSPDRAVPLVEAIDVDREALVQLLLDRGADPNVSAPGAASLASSFDVSRFVTEGPTSSGTSLDKAGPPTSTGDLAPGRTALSAASGHGNNKIVSLLIDRGADVDGKPRSRPLVEAARGNHGETFELLVSQGASPMAPWSDDEALTVGDEALASLAGQGDIAFTKMLLALGANPNAITYLSPLLRSAFFEHHETSAALLDAGANPNLGEVDALILLWYKVVASSGARKIIDEAIPVGSFSGRSSAGAATNTTAQAIARDRRFVMPPLFVALGRADQQTVVMLLEHGADPNAMVFDKYSPLYLVAADCNGDAVKVLLQHGASLGVSPPEGQPLDVACDDVRLLLTE